MQEKNASPEFVAMRAIGVVGTLAARYAAGKGERSMSEFRAKFWGRQMDDLMTEMGRQATICKVKLLDPGVIDAVLRNDASVCGSANPLSFKKLRDAMMLGFVVRDKSIEHLGAGETEALVTAIRERIAEHLGGQLGGPRA